MIHAATPRSSLTIFVLLVVTVLFTALVVTNHESAVPPYRSIPLRTVVCCYDIERWSTSIQTLQTARGASIVDLNALSRLQRRLILDRTAGFTVQTAATTYDLTKRLRTWQSGLNALDLAAAAPLPSAVQFPPVPVTVAETDYNLPIIVYHTTPPDFSTQLQALVDRGYTTVTLAQAVSAWHGGAPLPVKPVVLTFDDGLEDQMSAFALLKQYEMKATFYIINGGEASRWCIGASRRYNDPLQPAGGCGDAYLSWDQIRQLDQSGLINIGGHTLDHPELPKLSFDEERYEISSSKTGIEQEIGHPIRDFAYPYGEYDATTIQLVRAAGYATAVTTDGGTSQDPSNPYILERLRTTLNLP